MENDTIKISEKFLLGDLLKVVMQEMRTMPFSWAMLPEKDQQKIIDRVKEKTEEAVRQTVKMIAADARPHLVADVESVTFKDGIKAVLSVAKQAADRHELSDAVGTMVLIVLPHIEKHLGGEAPKADKDQPDLPIAA
jgi:hypothetical protein